MDKQITITQKHIKENKHLQNSIDNFLKMETIFTKIDGYGKNPLYLSDAEQKNIKISYNQINQYVKWCNKEFSNIIEDCNLTDFIDFVTIYEFSLK